MGVDRLEARRQFEAIGKTSAVSEDGTVGEQWIDLAEIIVDDA